MQRHPGAHLTLPVSERRDGRDDQKGALHVPVAAKPVEREEQLANVKLLASGGEGRLYIL